MTLYECKPYQIYQSKKWYKKEKNKKINNSSFSDDYFTKFSYANSKEEAKKKYWNELKCTKEKINYYFSLLIYYYENIKTNNEEIILSINEYQNNKTLLYLKSHMNSDDYLLYCKYNNIE